MNRSRLPILLLAAAALACLANPAASARGNVGSRYGGVLYVGLTNGSPDTLDPTLSRTFQAVEIYRSFCERLYDFDAKSRIHPELASSLPKVSKDKLTYTIPLRQNVLFNDATPFNAQAVVTTLERMINFPGSSRSSDYGPIQSLTAPDPNTVVIHLDSPFQPLLATLATNDGVIMSPAQLTKLGTNFGTAPVCVGPFMFDHQVSGDNVTVIKSPYYYDKYAVHLDKIVFKPETDPAAAVAALESGDIQVLDAVSPSLLPTVQANPNFRVLKGGGLGWSGIVINLGNTKGVGNLPYGNNGTPLASSPSLRQAFEEAIDRGALVKVVDQGAAVPGCTPVSPASAVFDPTVKCTPYDPKDAKALVARSGLTNPTVHLLVGPPDADAAQFIQAEEAAVGINVVIDAADQATVTLRSASGDFDTALGGFTGSPAFDRNVYEFVAGSGSRDYSGYDNPRLDLILANARKATSPAALKTLYHAAEEILIVDRPIIYLSHPTTYAAVSNSVSGVNFYADRQVRADFAQFR